MSRGPARIKSKGACIYCGVKDVDLTDEHIIPFALGGQHVIKKASCVECQKITTRFERDVARGLWGEARVSYNAPSRRKKKRKKYFYIEDKRNPGKKIKISANEYPSAMVFYEMGPAGFLRGCSEDADNSKDWKFKAIHDDIKVKNFEKNIQGS